MDPKTGGELQLSWDKNIEDDIDKYIVYRSETSGGPFEMIAESKSLVYRDLGLKNGKVYYYVIKAVDTAGNESEESGQKSGVPSAISDLTVIEIKTVPESPTYERSGKIPAVVQNKGYAKARGRVDFFYKDGDEWKYIDTSFVEVESFEEVETSIDWLVPKTIEETVQIKAEVETLEGSRDMDESNNFGTSDFRLNNPPTAIIDTEEWVYSGDEVHISGIESKDSDGYIVSYNWDLGDGTTKKARKSPMCIKILDIRHRLNY